MYEGAVRPAAECRLEPGRTVSMMVACGPYTTTDSVNTGIYSYSEQCFDVI